MKKALIVDDNEQNLCLLQTVLKEQGYDVMTAGNGVEALEHARRDPPDIIISDILMPVMDGFALCLKWQKDEGLQKIPFIFYTATYTDPQDEELALSLGAARFVVKPQEPEAFVALVREVLEERETGLPVEPVQSLQEEMDYCRLYKDALVRKLEDKMQQLKRANLEAQKSESFLRDVLRTTPSAVFTVDPDCNITSWNAMAGKITGYRAEEVLGNKCDILNSPMCSKECRLFDDRFQKPGDYSECVILSKDGRKLITLKNFDLLSSPSGEILGGVESFIDITERKQAEEQLRHTLNSLRKALNTTIQVMVSAVEVRDPYTSGHQNRSADLARAIAVEMGLPEDKIEGIRMAGKIHDIGKLSIPVEILSKPTKLTEIEFSLIKEHSRRGFEMLKDVESPWNLAEIAYQHHERMNGSGYPRNLKGEDILIEARILAVADTVEAMSSHRPYRPGLGISAALEEIEKNRGILYDADAADACLRLFREKRYELPQV